MIFKTLFRLYIGSSINKIFHIRTKNEYFEYCGYDINLLSTTIHIFNKFIQYILDKCTHSCNVLTFVYK